MAGERHGVASWPGVFAVESCQYTTSHGISPGVAALRCNPQPTSPAGSGTLTISDGNGFISLANCKLQSLRCEADERGFYWTLNILDRRWKWRDFGSISGTYNQLDDHGKLIPWTIRSPEELAILCLQKMGETRYRINLPPGLTAAIGRNFRTLNPEWLGVNPTTGTNPAVNWVSETPAVALQNLCELFGRHVIYQIASDSVLIDVPGKGDLLPDGEIAREAPAIKNPATPSAVAVYGSPTRYQARFLCEAVGREWHGALVPIEQLSYKPVAINAKAQGVTFTLIASPSSNTYQIFLCAAQGDPVTTGALFEASGTDAATVATALAAAINASTDERVKGVVTASAGSGVVLVIANETNKPFQYWSKMSGTVTDTASIVPELTQAAEGGNGDSWRYSDPPLFSNVQATDRLRYEDALRLAQETVFKFYRITVLAPSRNVGLELAAPGLRVRVRGIAAQRLRIPGYGLIERRQQIVLLPTRVEQQVPLASDLNLTDALGRPFLESVYNGWSRDKPARCLGSVATIRNGGVAKAFWVPGLGDEHTRDQDQIYIDFTIDPDEQVVMFSNCVYRHFSDGYFPARVVLETGCHVRNPDTNELAVYVAGRRIPGILDNNDIAVRKFLDVQLNVIGLYSAGNDVEGANLLEQDAVIRANYYAQGMVAQYLTEGGLTREYNGIIPIDLDGAIQQITWEVGSSGASTSASRNSEHSVFVPSYPARRRAEFLAPAQQAQLNNAANPGRIGDSLNRPG